MQVVRVFKAWQAAQKLLYFQLHPQLTETCQINCIRLVRISRNITVIIRVSELYILSELSVILLLLFVSQELYTYNLYKSDWHRILHADNFFMVMEASCPNPEKHQIHQIFFIFLKSILTVTFICLTSFQSLE